MVQVGGLVIRWPAQFGGYLRAGGGNHLHQPVSAGGGGGKAFEEALLPDEGEDEERVEIALASVMQHQVFVVGGVGQAGDEGGGLENGVGRGEGYDSHSAEDGGAVETNVAEEERQLVLGQRVRPGGIAEGVQFPFGLLKTAQSP